MPRKRKPSQPSRERPSAGPAVDTDIRIIGGEFRGRLLRYHGDPLVRPMKHRVREAIFNLLSTGAAERHAIDLFAGTGALGLEALSRGAVHATLIEKHVPTARRIEENILALKVTDRATLRVTSAFLWAKRDMPDNSEVSSVKSHPADPALNSQPSTLNSPWLVFCSPPYAFYADRPDEMLDLIGRIRHHAPRESILVVEADEQFDFNLLRGDERPASDPLCATGSASAAASAWDIRSYLPAVIGIWYKP